MKLLIFAASRRKESVNRKLAKLAAGIAEAHGADVDFAEYSEFDFPIYDDENYEGHTLPASAKQFAARLQNVDSIIIASPEYNWSFPGSLKNIIDWGSIIKPSPFNGKTVLLLSASPSLRGGAQGLIHLKVPLMHLGMYIFPKLFTLSRADEAFSEDGALKDRKLHQEVEQLVKQFARYTTALKSE